MKFFRSAAAVILLFSAMEAHAQFYSTGDDPAGLKWYSSDTPHFRVIFPKGQDSLARVYALELERWRSDTQRSVISETDWKWRLPVILHGANGYANGSVTWAPRQMDLFTVPNAYGADPFPWELNLAVHESRHVMQMLHGYRGMFRPLGWFLGDIVPGAFSALYPNMALLEGDAVVAETALTAAGRARTADFLNYYRVAFDEGDKRNWYRWRYGSYRYYAPDYYALGYLTIAGMRVFYDDPLFTKEYFDGVIRHPFRIAHLSHAMKDKTGKNLRKSFADIMDGFHAIWTEDAAARGPFENFSQITPPPSFHTDYTCNIIAGGSHFVLKEGLLDSRSLSKVLPDGRVVRVKSFAAHSSSLFHDPVKGRIYWSETVPHPRWSLSHTSRIRYMSENGGLSRDLTRKGRLYNPSPSPDGECLSVVEYPFAGGSNILIISASDGSEQIRIPGPEAVQLSESAWFEGRLYALGLSGGGFGIYSHEISSTGSWKEEIPPSVTKMQNLGAGDDYIEFVCDAFSVNEIYKYYPSSGKTVRLSNTRYGSTDYAMSESGDTLYFSTPTIKGFAACSIPADGLKEIEVDLSAARSHPVEDRLSEQEKALAAASGREIGSVPDNFTFSSPKRYHKLLHPAMVHAWAPFYFNYDEVSEMSGDISWSTVAPGATILFQNTLGTLSGFAGYAFRPDDDGDKKWRHTGHAKLTWSGLFPVISASFDVGDRLAHQYSFKETESGEITAWGIGGKRLETPLVSASVKAYVPLNFSKGGVYRGVVPSVQYAVTNDYFNPSVARLTTDGNMEGTSVERFTGVDVRKNVPMQAMVASLRGYAIRQTAESRQYPDLGIGAEGGIRIRPGIMPIFTPAAYGYLYGYIPGFSHRHGFKLTALYQHIFYGDRYYRENAVSVLPRGFSSSVGQYVAALSPDHVKATVDYSIPIFVGDMSFLGPVMYMKNLLVSPHFDFMGMRGGNLFSAGATVSVAFSNLLWFPFGGEIGVQAGYNGGSLLKGPLSGLGAKHYYVEAVFHMDI